MLPPQSFTHRALQLAAQGEPIPINENVSQLLPGLLWSGHFTDFTYEGLHVFASLTEKGRAFLAWLES